MIPLLLRLIQVYQLILTARAILSFVYLARPDFIPPDWLRPIIDFIMAVTEPVLRKIRELMPWSANAGGIDLSFIVLFFGLSILGRVIANAAF